ncbi:GerAB/ArcD/ProY family transporter [Staphylospora marina]|uniref:GerAB/ArcD/ProY family transporter n=1 Tax=Staphylospora marina TaxID=2490858 RepID=UPI0013DDB6A7|nr:endospore germination permease [Staphylospora marina]
MSHSVIDSGKRSVTPYQAFALVHSTMLGAGVLYLPRDVGVEAGKDAVWVVLLSALPILLFLYFISKLLRRFPGETLVEFAPKILGPSRHPNVGRWISFLLILLPLGVFWILGLAYMARMFGESVVTGVLLRTPIEAVILSILFATAVAAGSKVGVLVRFNELLLPLTFFPVIFVIFSTLQRGDLIRVLPLFSADWKQIVSGMAIGMLAYPGFKITLIFGGYYQQPESSAKSHTAAVLTVTFIYWLLVINAMSVFGPHELVQILWPVLESMKEIQFQNFILERMEAGILIIWVIAVYTTMANLYAAFIEMTMQHFRLRERWRKWLVLACIPVIYYLALIPEDLPQSIRFSRFIGVTSLVLAGTIPPILLILAMIRRKRRGREHETAHSA